MTTTRRMLPLLVALAASAANGAAHAQPALRYAPTAAAATRAEPHDLRERLERAQLLAEQGDFKGARRAYTSILREQRRAGTLPTDALWNLARLHAAEGRIARAALLMDELAVAAETHGHPVVQSRALLEAAVFHHRVGRNDLALARIQRLDQLLDSPFLSAADRAAIERRIIRG